MQAVQNYKYLLLLWSLIAADSLVNKSIMCAIYGDEHMEMVDFFPPIKMYLESSQEIHLTSILPRILAPL